MPIFEFKCLNCQEHMEVLVLGANDEKREMQCSKCGCQDLERIISTTNFSMGRGKSDSSPSTQSRTCSSGSCTTWNLPGHS
jgi:putative FmdB family regulatory protein